MLLRTKTTLLPIVILLALFLTAPVLADVILLKGGGRVEGEILSEDADNVKIKTRFGTMDIPRGRIESIKRGKSIRQEFAERKDALAKDDAPGHFELAGWAKEQGLRKEAKALYEEAARIDPMHAGANEALGRVLFDGRYMSPEEKEAALLKDTEAREMAARGLVRYKDRWVTPEEKAALEKGLVKHDGRWMTPDDKKKAEGFVKFKGRWVKGDDLDRLKDLDRFQSISKATLSAMDTEHFRLFSVYPEAETRKVADALEQTYQDFLRDFAIDPKERLFYKAKCRIFLFQKALAFDRFLVWFGEEMEYEPQRIDLIRQNRGTYYIYPEPYVVGYQFPDPFEQLMGRTIHKTSHVMLLAWLYNARFLPWWITEGLGEFHEISVLGRCDTFCITIRGYGNAGGPSAEKWQNSDDWKAKLKSAVAALIDPDVRTFKGKSLNDLTHADLAKSWSMVSWLLERRRERFIEFIKLLKQGKTQDMALEQAFETDWRQLDKDWREYVRANY